MLRFLHCPVYIELCCRCLEEVIVSKAVIILKFDLTFRSLTVEEIQIRAHVYHRCLLAETSLHVVLEFIAGRFKEAHHTFQT